MSKFSFDLSNLHIVKRRRPFRPFLCIIVLFGCCRLVACSRIQYLPWHGRSCICRIGDLPNILQNVLRHCRTRSSSRPLYPARLSVLAVVETVCYYQIPLTRGRLWETWQWRRQSGRDRRDRKQSSARK